MPRSEQPLAFFAKLLGFIAGSYGRKEVHFDIGKIMASGKPENKVQVYLCLDKNKVASQFESINHNFNQKHQRKMISPERKRTRDTEACASVISPHEEKTKRSRQTKENHATLQRAYRVIRKHSMLAYNSSTSGTYGWHTQSSMTSALEAMNLTAEDVFCDVGAGVGAPCFSGAIQHEKLTCYGIELSGTLWWFSIQVLRKLADEVQGRVFFAHLDLKSLRDFGSCTVVYSFDAAMPPLEMKAYAAAFNNSTRVRMLGSYRPPQVLIEEYGFEGLCLMKQLSMTQSGSSSTSQLYLYSVLPKPSSAPIISLSWNLPLFYPPPELREHQPLAEHDPTYVFGKMRGPLEILTHTSIGFLVNWI